MTAAPVQREDGLVLHQHDARGVHRLTLNSPKSFNVLGEAVLGELQRQFDAIAADPTARVLVIAAEGKAFCAGHDLKQMKANPQLAYYQRLFAQCSKMMMSIQKLPMPVIARASASETTRRRKVWPSLTMRFMRLSRSRRSSGVTASMLPKS